MRKISKSVYAEMYYKGSNDAVIVTDEGVFMVDTPMYPQDAMRWKEVIKEFGPLKYLVNTEPHGDHIFGNAYFPEVEVIGQVGLKARYEAQIPNMFSEQRAENMKNDDPLSVHFINHPAYPPNPPTRTFEDKLTMEFGGLTIEMIHAGGHTDPQTHVYLPSEGIVFPGDNIFHQTKSFLQEGDPWRWIEALKEMKQLDIKTIMPGHGEEVGPEYIDEQIRVIQNWISLVEGFIQKGLTLEESLQQPLDMPSIDPYPIGPGLHKMGETLDATNIKNIYPMAAAKLGVKA